MTVRRYDNWKSRTISSSMDLSKNGEYVEYTDYEALHKAAKKSLDVMERYKDKCQCNRFDTEIELLKKELNK